MMPSVQVFFDFGCSATIAKNVFTFKADSVRGLLYRQQAIITNILYIFRYLFIFQGSLAAFTDLPFIIATLSLSPILGTSVFYCMTLYLNLSHTAYRRSILF